MNFCTLHPPNYKRLSEDVIPGVVLRRNRLDQLQSAGVDDIRPGLPVSKRWHTRESGVNNLQPEPKRTRHEYARHSESKEHLQSDEVCNENLHSTAAIAELLKLGKSLERERRRVNQARYRKKQNDSIINLEGETEALRHKIKTLQERKRVQSSQIQHTASVWNVAMGYFRVFSYGLRSTSRSSGIQQIFLESTVTPDVIFNADQGIESILRSWECLSSWFGSIEVEVQEIQKSVEGSILATTATSFTITEQTLHRVFPHLAVDGSLGDRTSVAKKLLGQRIKLHGWSGMLHTAL